MALYYQAWFGLPQPRSVKAHVYSVLDASGAYIDVPAVLIRGMIRNKHESVVNVNRQWYTMEKVTKTIPTPDAGASEKPAEMPGELTLDAMPTAEKAASMWGSGPEPSSARIISGWVLQWSRI